MMCDCDSGYTCQLHRGTIMQRRGLRIRQKTRKKSMIGRNQSWFWTSGWQAKERDVDEELRREQYEEFDNMDDFLATL